MNQQKVVDELQECIDDGSTDLVCVQEAITVIRQQADRIAELEKELEKTSKAAMELREIYVNRIAELQSSRRKAWD